MKLRVEWGFGFFVMPFMVAPFCGFVGAGAGWIASGIDWWGAL